MVNRNLSNLIVILIALIYVGTNGPLIHVAGITLTGSSYAVLDQTYRFTCTATEASSNQSLSFTKNGGSVCVLIHLSNHMCKQFTTTSGYTCFCGQNGLYYMNISSVSLQDEITWNCQLSLWSLMSNNISLSVYYGPFNNVTIDRSSPVTVIENVTTRSVRCSAHCKPSCSYTWRKGNEQMSNTRDLPLGSLTKNDGDDYTCRVSNTEAGVNTTAQSHTLTVNVQWYPAQPTHTCPSWILLGQSGSCTCQTSDPGNPAGTVQWINPQGQTVSSTQSTSVSLNLANIPRSDNKRIYTCRANNSLTNSNTDKSYNVNIAYPPDKPTINETGSLCEGKSTSLTCSSSDPGNPPATYYWTKNTVSVATGSPYTFTPGRDDHQAQIRCEAGNNHTDRSEHSRPQSDVKELNIYYIPMITISPAPDLTRKEGQNLSLTCSADSNPDNAVLSWTFNGTTLTGVSVEKTNLSRSDHGVYTCIGRVNTGSVCPGGFLQGQGSVTVIVNFAPDIIFKPVDIREGEALMLTCEANGRPETYTFGRFTQYWEDTEVERNTGTKTRAAYTWTKYNATYLETGVYECSVDNTVTDRRNVLVQTKRVSVHVRTSPKFTTDMEQIFGAEVGSPVTLTQSFYNSYLNYTSVNWTSSEMKSLLNESSTVTPTNVTLKKNGKAVQVDGFNASVVIEDFQEEDIGTYTVTACNSFGCSSSDVNLTAAGPPLVPLDFEVMNASQNSITLKWKPNFPGGDFTQVFILHYRLQGSEDWQTVEYEDNPGGYVFAHVTGLQSGSVYDFKVQARNSRENDNEGEFTKIMPGTTIVPTKPPNGFPVVAIAAGAGVAFVVVILVAIVVSILMKKRRRQQGSDAEKEPTLALHESAHGAEREQPEMHDNVLYDTTEGAMGGEKPVMEDNVLYAGSGDILGAAPSESVQKKSNAKEHKDQKKKDKKKNKKEDKKQASPKKQKRDDVYENTVPGQFLAGAEASAFANAGFVGDENHYEETAGATANAEKQASGRNEDGLLYVGIDFGKQKPSQEVHGAEERTEYAGIAFGKVGQPLPPDEEEKDEEKKESNAS